MTIKTSNIRCYEVITRRWEASYPQVQGVKGTGHTSVEAIRSLRKEIKKKQEQDLRNIYQPRFTCGMGEGS